MFNVRRDRLQLHAVHQFLQSHRPSPKNRPLGPIVLPALHGKKEVAELQPLRFSQSCVLLEAIKLTSRLSRFSIEAIKLTSVEFKCPFVLASNSVWRVIALHIFRTI